MKIGRVSLELGGFVVLVEPPGVDGAGAFVPIPVVGVPEAVPVPVVVCAARQAQIPSARTIAVRTIFNSPHLPESPT
jgi:hypothetical protein